MKKPFEASSITRQPITLVTAGSFDLVLDETHLARVGEERH